MKDELLTIPRVLDELGVARSTWTRWCALGVAPRRIKLPNGTVRVRRSVLTAWIESREESAA